VDAWQLGLGYTYHISKRTHLYAAAAYFDSKYKKDGVKVTNGDKDSNSSTKIKSLMCGMYHTF
jgi:predicted porin